MAENKEIPAEEMQIYTSSKNILPTQKPRQALRSGLPKPGSFYPKSGKAWCWRGVSRKGHYVQFYHKDGCNKTYI